MPWSKLDDQYPDHPKIVKAGPLASWLNTCAICYCSRYLTDGFVPLGQVRKLADVDDAMGLAETLVRVGLWVRCDGGFMVHDYLEYNPTRERVIATRDVRSEAGSKGGKQKASNLLEVSQDAAIANDVAKLYPVPVPVPVPTPMSENGAHAPAPAREKLAKRHEYSHDSDEYRLAMLLSVRIHENLPGSKTPTEAILQRWADTTRKIHDLDERPLDEAHDLLLWSQQDTFWQSVILSMDKFRDQYDQIAAQRLRKEREGQRSNGRPVEPIPPHYKTRWTTPEKAESG